MNSVRSFLVLILLIYANKDRVSASDAMTQDPSLRNPIPYALSPTYLTFLARQERKIYNAMKEYIEALEKRMKLLRR